MCEKLSSQFSCLFFKVAHKTMSLNRNVIDTCMVLHTLGFGRYYYCKDSLSNVQQPDTTSLGKISINTNKNLTLAFGLRCLELLPCTNTEIKTT